MLSQYFVPTSGRFACQVYAFRAFCAENMIIRVRKNVFELRTCSGRYRRVRTAKTSRRETRDRENACGSGCAPVAARILGELRNPRERGRKNVIIRLYGYRFDGEKKKIRCGGRARVELGMPHGSDVFWTRRLSRKIRRIRRPEVPRCCFSDSRDGCVTCSGT